MPPGALRRYLQFPNVPVEGDDPVAQQPAAAPMTRLMPGAGAAAAPRGGGVQTVNVTAPRSGGVDDDIQQQIDALKSLQANRPQMNIGQAPGRQPLPERPQASAWEALPQLFAGAGNVLSAGSNHPQDYLTPLMNRQQGMRDQAYGDRLAQAQNMFQNEREAYTDKLMRYSMELRDHQQRAGEAHGLLQTLMEQKYLTGQKTPQDMQDTQKREGYRAIFDKFDMLKEAEDHARELKATRPEDAKMIDEVLQNKKAAVGGRGQGMVEYLTNTPAGRGMFESPEGPIRQPAGIGEMPGRAKSLQDAIKNPDKYYPNHKAMYPNDTKEQFIQKMKAALKKSESDEPAESLLPKKFGIADRLRQEMQGSGQSGAMLEQWARKQRESKD